MKKSVRLEIKRRALNDSRSAGNRIRQAGC